MTAHDLCAGLLEFLSASPTPFHATQALAKILQNVGFEALNEHDAWQLKPGGRYYVIRSGSSLVAFVYGEKPLQESGLRIIGAHTDSPCLKIKPSPERNCKGYSQLGVEVYGGALLNPWFDRDLSIAGRLSYVDTQGELKSTLIDFVKPVAYVPSLAIHLDREANDKRSVNPQTDMNVILQLGDSQQDFREILKQQLNNPQVDEVLDFNLCCYDTQPPAIVGMQEEFIASARLDNLLSCYLGAVALAEAPVTHSSLLICSDHEEVGSRSDVGAQGPLLSEVMDRLVDTNEARQRMLRRSLMISADNAHGIHPNYPNRHDDQHSPLINRGPVIKFDANQGYATSSSTAAQVRWLAKRGDVEIPLQTYVTRADMRCGSTIGPLTAAAIGITTVDIGLATFAMHSIRELGGVSDLKHMRALLGRFLSCDVLPPSDTA